MLSPQLRKKVHSLWTLFWAAGISNPLAAIEQITYLLFIRELEGLDKQRVDAGKPSIYGRGPDLEKVKKGEYQHSRWSYIRRAPSFELLNNTVFPWLRSLEKGLADDVATNGGTLSQITGRLADAYFILDTNKTDTLTRAVGHIDELFKQLDTRSANADIMGGKCQGSCRIGHAAIRSQRPPRRRSSGASVAPALACRWGEGQGCP